MFIENILKELEGVSQFARCERFDICSEDDQGEDQGDDQENDPDDEQDDEVILLSENEAEERDKVTKASDITLPCKDVDLPEKTILKNEDEAKAFIENIGSKLMQKLGSLFQEKTDV